MSIIRLNINGIEVVGHEGQTILEVAKDNEIQIPNLCHDERVKSQGSCGVCVVEMEGMPRLIRACSTVANYGMIIKTNTKRVIETRRTALELMLSDHTGDCRPPCVLACPAQTDCQGYVGLIANGQHKEAAMLIKDKIPMPASIGRVCPHPCETACRRELVEEPIDIAHLKQFAADRELLRDDIFNAKVGEDTGKKIAIIGGGPGGLTAAYFLRQKGHEATIYDAMPKMGGMLVYGIPEYRLPKEIVDKETKAIENMGVKFVNEVKIGKDLSFEYLREKFDSVIVAIGAWTSMSLRCKGEDLEGVVGGIDFLRDVTLNNPMLTGKKVAIVGGGNTAMDACRTAVRLGASEVYNIYRRTKNEMPAEAIEIEEAEEEGVIFKNLTNPIEVIGENNKVTKIRLQIMELGEPDASGRRSPIAVEGAEETLEVDTVIVAIGQGLDATGFENLELTKWRTISADEETFRTNLDNVFAIGDATNKGADIAITAIGEAKKAVEVIDAYLNGKAVKYENTYLVKREDVTIETLADREKKARVSMKHLSAKTRKDNFHEVNKGFTEEEAIEEAKRCLECGCHDYFECKLITEANQCDVKPEKFEGEEHNRSFVEDHPFIKRNPDKCILCGLCVRICEEAMGITALGLIDRGFDTVVQPALGLPLKESGCISCGQCVSVCPTGALIEETGAKKQVPLKEIVRESVCSYCGVGCTTKVTTTGDIILRHLPNQEIYKDAILCAKGRFGIANPVLKDAERIIKPMIRKDGVLTEVSFQEAYIYISKKMQGISAVHGVDKIAVSVSDQFVNEDIFAIKKYANEVLNTENVVSFNMVESGLKQTLGYDASTSNMDELLNAEVILVIEKDLMKTHTIATVKMMHRTETGAKIITINDSETYLDAYATHKLEAGEGLSKIKEFAKALIDMGLSPKNAQGFEEFKKYIGNIEVDDETRAAAELYAKAKSAMIVFDQNALSTDAAKLIASIALISDNIAKSRRGIVQFKPNVNSQGLADMGIAPATELFENISSKKIKGMMIFGEDVSEIDLSSLEFLMVADCYVTETAKKADVVLPFAEFLRTDGTVTNSFWKIQEVEKSLLPVSGFSNLEIIKGLANISTEIFNYKNAAEVRKEISRKTPEYRKVCTVKKPIFAYKSDTNVLYEEGFNFEDGKARMLVPQKEELYSETKNTYWAYNKFMEFVKNEGINQS